MKVLQRKCEFPEDDQRIVFVSYSEPRYDHCLSSALCKLPGPFEAAGYSGRVGISGRFFLFVFCNVLIWGGEGLARLV